MTIKQAIETLKAESSTNEKINLIKQFAETIGNDFINTLKYTYDDLKVYGVKKYNKPEKHLGTMKLDASFAILDSLDAREFTGNSAVKLVEEALTKLSEDNAYVFDLILQRDLKCGINKKLIKKALGDHIFFEIGYMGAVTYDPKKIEKILSNNIFVFSQEKMDGEYMHMLVEETENGYIFDFYTRKNKKIYMLRQIVNKLKRDLKHFSLDHWFPKKIVFNGELMVSGYDRYTSNGLLTRIFKVTEYVINGESEKKIKNAIKAIEDLGNDKIQNIINKIEYYVWDFQDSEKQYYERWLTLFGKSNPISKFTDFIKPVDCWIIINQDKFSDKWPDADAKNLMYRELVGSKKLFYSETEAGFRLLMKHFEKIAEKDGEGTVVKAGNNKWKEGKPSNIVKIKKKFQCEMKIVGFKQGTPGTKYENSLGALICESEDGKVKCDASGLTDSLRDEIWNNKNEYLNKIITIESNALSIAKDSDHYRLLHPRFTAFRDDKNKADDLETIREIYESSLKL